MRTDNRDNSSLRNIKIIPHVMPYAEGSVKIHWGKTEIICSASVEENTPRWLYQPGHGWITAEYSMLPRSTSSRMKREAVLSSGRTKEISRLIGRSLRASCHLGSLGERQIHIDCDVVQADGGTRVASITGGFVALALAIKKLMKKTIIKKNPLLYYVAGVSVVILNNQILVDPSFEEDKECSTDINIVSSSHGDFIEIQGTAEKSPFSTTQFNQMTEWALKSCQNLFQIQSQIIGDFFPLKNKP